MFVPLKETPFVHDPLPKYVAELVGTFFLVFTVGCNVHTGSIGAAVSIGGILMVMVYALGSVSGAHLNPAVTFAVGLSGRGKISVEDMFCYMASQITGGLLGAFCYWIIFNDAFLLRPLAGYSRHDAVAVEVLYTMALCYVVLNVATTENPEQGNGKNSFFGLAIGLTVTSAAIAIGPISGCSLNPAVSLGAFFASKLAHGVAPVSLVVMYILSPLGGAAIATLFFYFVQGGLTGQFEYEFVGTRPPSPITSRPPSPAPRPRLPQRSGSKYLFRNDWIPIPAEVEHHNIFLGLSWNVTADDKEDEGASAPVKAAQATDKMVCADIDASCVKFTSDAKLIEAIYFSNSEGKEVRRTKESIVLHRGDNITGKGTGFGMESPGKPGEIKDDERIQIKHLAELRKHQPRAQYLFFVINVFSAAHKFEHMKDMTIRIVDEDNGFSEICRFEKKDFSRNKMNGFVLGVLYWREEDNIWIFQVIDEIMDIKEHGTYREFEPKLAAIVRRMEGLVP